jgi:hypothetical protein
LPGQLLAADPLACQAPCAHPAAAAAAGQHAAGLAVHDVSMQHPKPLQMLLLVLLLALLLRE